MWRGFSTCVCKQEDDEGKWKPCYKRKPALNLFCSSIGRNLSKADDTCFIASFILIAAYPFYNVVASSFSVLIRYKTYCLRFLGSAAICGPMMCLKLKTGHICVHILPPRIGKRNITGGANMGKALKTTMRASSCHCSLILGA